MQNDEPPITLNDHVVDVARLLRRYGQMGLERGWPLPHRRRRWRDRTPPADVPPPNHP